MARFIDGYDFEDSAIDFEFLDGGESEELVRILMEEFDIPDDEDEDDFLDEELDEYGEEW
jgi:hypothetical protein